MPIFNTQQHKGSALLSALFIMTLVAIATTAMTMRLQIDIYKTDLTLKSNKPYLASQLVVFWGITELKNSKNALNVLDKKGAVARFPKSLETDYPGIKLRGYILDMQGFFNLNNLRKQSGQAAFERLIKNLQENNADTPVKKITEAAWYWQNSYRLGRGRDKLMRVFLKQKPPLLPAQMPFVSISELRMIPGVNAKLWNQLSPWITALPEPTATNLNTAARPILSILGNGLSESQVENIIQARQETPLGHTAQSANLIQSLHLNKNEITLKSNYFLVVAIAEKDQQAFINYSLFERKNDRRKQNKIKVSLLRESFNVL